MGQQINVNIRMDKEIKERADALFAELGFNLTTAVNTFVRQALREQAIPFPVRAQTADEKYREYFNPHNTKILLESIAQAERGEVITFTMPELEAMESGVIPQRAVDFLEAHKSMESASHDW